MDGLTRPNILVKKVKELEMNSVAITDHGNMYGVIEFYKECKANDIKPIIGFEAYICKDMNEKGSADNETHHLTLLAENNEGYQNLLKLVSSGHLEGFYRKPRIDFNKLINNSKGIIVLSGCLGGELSQLILSERYKEARDLALTYQFIFGNRYYIEIQRHPNNTEQCKVTPQLIKLAKELDIQMVATCDSHYTNKEDKYTHEVLLAIQTGKKMTDPKRMSLANNDIYVASSEEVYNTFNDIPEAIENTQKIADRCNVDIELGKIKLPPYNKKFSSNYDDELAYMCRMYCDKMFPNNDEYRKRMEYELSVIGKTNFSSYLLIVQDIVNWGKGRGIIFGPGRGSAAGCLLSYLLGITTIDPIRYGLFFERFMNPDRISPPDIDIDIEDKRRDEVIEYICNTYGKENVAQIITFGSMFARTCIRDVGRVTGIDIKTCDRVAKEIPFGSSIENALEKASGFKNEYKINKELIDVSRQLEGTIRHSGVHACGVVISDKPLTEYIPVQLSKEKHLTSQFDMNSVDDLGLLKMDMLGLRSLSVIAECQKLIEIQFGHNIDINKIPLNDTRTYKLFQLGKTTSVFQLESDGMKRYLKELKPSQFNDISAMVALYRPGPMELIKNYIDRKYGRERVEYLDPKLEPILKDTYGIMIYQEQLMAAVRALAGLTLAQADVLRKAVGKKIKKLLDEQEGRFKEGCKNVGTSKYVADKFWSLVEPFSNYGFNLSHSVSYAMIAYQTAYLKSNYPVQFMLAELNSDTHIDRVSELMIELGDMGIKMLPPNVNSSESNFSSEGNNVRFSISAIKGLGEKTADMIIKNRGLRYDSIEDFAIKNKDRILNKKTVELLSRSGALEDFGDRSQLTLSADIIAHYSKLPYQNLLPKLVLPIINKTTIEQKILWEKELIGFYLSSNPVHKYYELFDKMGALDVNGDKIGGVIVNIKKNIKKDGTYNYKIRLMCSNNTVDLIVGPNVFDRNRNVFQENTVVILSGRNNGNRFICLGGQVV